MNALDTTKWRAARANRRRWRGTVGTPTDGKGRYAQLLKKDPKTLLRLARNRGINVAVTDLVKAIVQKDFPGWSPEVVVKEKEAVTTA